jgi:hypothetical protein
MKATPDHHDATLMLQVYELRREPVMRDSRTAINNQFWPRTYDDVLAVAKPDHPLNSAYRQTSTYWEMVYGIAKHGIVNPDYWIEGNAEGLFLYARVAPFIEQIRRDSSPRSYLNAEWMAHTEGGRKVFETFRDRVQKVLAQPAKNA